jgi:serine/threonine protein kinase
VRELGRGAVGVVWQVDDLASGLPLALKYLLSPSAAAILRLKREFRVLAPLAHPHLVRLHDLWSDEREPFFTMELVEGRDLRSLLEAGRLASGRERVRLAFDLSQQVLPALAFLHAVGVVHRDLKPSNLMVGADRAVKLVDFGMVAPLDEAGAHDRRAGGSHAYAAPEQLRDEAPTAATDLYSLGLVLSEVLLGGAPAPTAGAAARERIERAGDAIPRTLRALCLSLLQDDAGRRPDAAAALRMLDGSGGPRRSVSETRRAATPREASAARDAATPAGRDAVTGAGVPCWLAPRIEDVSDGAFAVVILERPTQGLGAVRHHARRVGGIVLAAERRPSEHVEYNVLDAAVDSLAALCLETQSDAELARDLGLASVAFPVLGGPRSPGVSAPVSRSRAFDALIRILASFAGAGGVYLVIEGVDQADAKSLAFLDRLLERRPAGVGVVASLSAGTVPAAFRQWLETQRRLVRECVDRSGAFAWTSDSSTRAKVPGGAVASSRLGAPAMAPRGLLAEPENLGERHETRRDMAAIRAEGHAQAIGGFLLRGGGLDERQLQDAGLLRAARR